MSFIENPFLNNKSTITHFDESEGKSVEIDQTNAPKYFSHVFILAKRNNEPIPSDFYNWQVSSDVFEQVSSNLLIHKTSIKVLKNKTHFDNCIMLSEKQLKPYNIFNYELANKNIVIPIFNVEYINLLQYLEQYESNDNLQSIYNIKVLNKYFGVDDSNFKANEFVCQIINNLEESEYWTNYYNCLINMSNKFKDRTMSFQSTRMTDKNVASIVKKIFDVKTTNDTKKEDYIKEIELTPVSKKDDYIDISSVIEKKGYRLYKIGAKCEFTRQDINQLFSVLNEKQRFLLFANLIASKKYCHLVLNNEYILQIMKKEMEQFAPLFKYLMSYAWIRFYVEECLKKTWVKTSDDFIFDINTASKLPVFPFNHAKPKENPYSPILVSDSELKPTENLCGISDYSTIYGPQGISNLDEFRIRMNIFCTGNPNNDLFEGFDFDKHKVAITGSLMTACLQKFHPLMSRFSNSDTQTEKFINYFNEYYANSDIDVMFMIKNNFQFVENVHEFYNQLVLNVCKFNAPYAEPSHVKLILNKLGYLFVNEEFINKNIHFDESTQITNKVKYVIENISDDIVKSKFKPFYEQLRIQKYNEIVKDYSDEEIVQLKKRYPDIFTHEGVDFRVYVNHNTNKFKPSETKHIDEDISEQEDQEIGSEHKVTGEIELVYTYKYKIESPHLNHSLELFSLKYDDFFSIVARFHLPCVRGYYNGSNVYLTPSCISAHMTYMNLDYKYITGSKDPFDIINKNRMRGFGTWLNSNEKKLFVKYSREVPFWNNLYLVDSSSSETEAAKNIFGTVSINHKLFRPRLYNMDSFVNAMFVDTSNRYNDSSATPIIYDNSRGMASYVQEKFQSVGIKEINWDNFISIDKDGYIVPLKKWVIASTLHIYTSEYKRREFKNEKQPQNSEKNKIQKPKDFSIIKKMLIQKKTEINAEQTSY
jgi:hypothetical protein